jgi:hypothetical protein
MKGRLFKSNYLARQSPWRMVPFLDDYLTLPIIENSSYIASYKVLLIVEVHTLEGLKFE